MDEEFASLWRVSAATVQQTLHPIAHRVMWGLDPVRSDDRKG
jgi:hypothetical protein